MQKRRMLIFRPMHNSHGKRDVTGAFAPEADRYADTVCTKGSMVVTINNKKPFWHRRRQVLEVFEEALDNPAFFDGVAFVCHGWKHGIQLGFRSGNVDELAEWIHAVCQHSFLEVPLYCCSTGGDVLTSRTSPGTGDYSFADLLRDDICRWADADDFASYCRIMAHETVAHTTKNPRVRFFDGMGSPAGGVGGYRPARPGAALWSAWKRELRNRDSDFRLWMPHLTMAEIVEWLKAA